MLTKYKLLTSILYTFTHLAVTRFTFTYFHDGDNPERPQSIFICMQTFLLTGVPLWIAPQCLCSFM